MILVAFLKLIFMQMYYVYPKFGIRELGDGAPIGRLWGMLLTRYCPEHGVRHSGTMWLFVALTAAVAPVGLVLLRRYIRVHEVGRED